MQSVLAVARSSDGSYDSIEVSHGSQESINQMKSLASFGKLKKYNKEIEAGHCPAPAYESVYILAEAMERAGTIDPDAVVTALEKTDRQGAIGRIRFGKNHQVVYGNDPKETAMAAMIQWSKTGTREIVFPESIADAKIHLPEGLKSAK